MNSAKLEFHAVSDGLDVLNARYAHQPFLKHSHSEYVFGIIRAGLHKVWCRGEWWQVGAGTIATLSPDEPHFGGNGNEHGWAQTMFYVPETTLQDLVGRSDAPLDTTLHFETPFHRDETTYQLLARAT